MVEREKGERGWTYGAWRIGGGENGGRDGRAGWEMTAGTSI